MMDARHPGGDAASRMSQPAHQFQVFSGTTDLAQAVARRVAEAAAQATRERGRFRIALSGGSAMLRLAAGFRLLPELPAHWAAWRVFWADERCVPADDPASNYGAARAEFLDDAPIPADQIFPVNGALPPDEAAAAHEAALRREFAVAGGAWPRFDVILLGVGGDGHTASLFPGDPALAEATRWAAPVWQSPKPPPMRVTLTLPVLNAARQVFFVATGHDKARVVHQVCAGAGKTPLPAQRVHLTSGPCEWFIDEQAREPPTSEPHHE